MKPAGYLINTRNGTQGERGFIYDYILAANGVFLEARSPLIEARLCIGPAAVRGLSPMEELVNLPRGKVPRHIYDLAVSLPYLDIHKECYLAITWDGDYHIKKPCQDSDESHVKYEVVPSTLIDIHSHGTGPAFYSCDFDDRDEQGFRLSLVMGRLDTFKPEMQIRLVMYGHFAPVDIREVFEDVCLE